MAKIKLRMEMDNTKIDQRTIIILKRGKNLVKNNLILFKLN